MRFLAFCMGVMLLAGGTGWAAGSGCPLAVPAPGAGARLPHAGVGRLEILALGSGSMMHLGGAAERSVPEMSAAMLRAALPGREVGLRMIGRRGATAAEMLVSLKEALAGGGVRLVLWQTGTVEAIRHVPPAAFRATLAEGLRLIAVSGADAVLVDPLYSRKLEERVDVRPYRAALQEAAAASGAVMFDRFGLMRGWAEAGLDLDRTKRGDRASVIALVQGCLAEALAATVRAGLN